MARAAQTRQPVKPRMLSLFSGIGGIDLSAEMAGWDIAGQVEIDPFCRAVLAKHWPDVKRVADVRNVWGDTFNGPIHLIVAGFPCPPVSVAGKRRGSADDRWLWPEALRVIQVYEPAWVLLENVSGLISLGLDGVLTDLDAAGYEAWPLVLSAAAVGAPHQRERVFIVAHVAHATSAEGGRIQQRGLPANAQSGSSDVEHASGAGREERHSSRVACDAGHPARRPIADRRARRTQPAVGRTFDGLSRRLDGDQRDDASEDAYPYQPWPAGPGDAQYLWEPPRVTSERIPHRAARLKALGNAVVPAQVYPILAAIIQQWRDEQANAQIVTPDTVKPTKQPTKPKATKRTAQRTR
jgi:DNA (cytosine-5)-methyltransferase 1